MPRKPGGDLARLPSRVWRAVREARDVLDDVDADVVVGFGGYVALPAYLAARGLPLPPRRRRRIPVVIHEANARAGLANRVGAHTADRVLSAVPDSGLRRAEVVGVPVRASIAALDRAVLRAEARAHFGFPDDARVLLVFGVRRARSRSTGRCPAPPPTWPPPVFACCMPMDPRTCWSCAVGLKVTHRTWRCPIWTGWSWPTPPPIW